MKDPLNSSVFGSFASYLKSLTWERGLVVLFTLLIACEIAVLTSSVYLYDKLNERTPIYVQCDEVARAEQMLELRNYIASSTAKAKNTPKKVKTKVDSTKSQDKAQRETKAAKSKPKSIKKGTL